MSILNGRLLIASQHLADQIQAMLVPAVACDVSLEKRKRLISFGRKLIVISKKTFAPPGE
jgi:hypothetical protein